MHADAAGVEDLPRHDAILAAEVFATDPVRFGGIVVRAPAGHARDAWMNYLASLLSAGTPLRRIPLHISDERLLGGLDLSATLAAGRPVAMRGILEEANGGVIVLPCAERLDPALASRITSAIDLGAIAVERDGFARKVTTRFAFIALDEGCSEDERLPSAIMDRAALHIDLGAADAKDFEADPVSRSRVTSAASKAISAMMPPDIIEVLVETAAAIGISSTNALLQALHVARAIAALNDRDLVSEADAAAAARLVFAPRATQLPQCQEPAPDLENSHPNEREAPADHDPQNQPAETLTAATKAAIPPHLLETLRAASAGRSRKQSSGKVGEKKKSEKRGRRVGVRSGAMRTHSRLNLVETLRAAAPWQPIRKVAQNSTDDGTGRRVLVTSSDFRLWKLKARSETMTVFVVDASGSTANHRLGEAKGAVELLLAECYSRRDQVALITFGGRGANLVLAPTRSLTRAKRNLAEMPGGGGTPLASGIDAAISVCAAAKRKGQTPCVVVLTDGRANLNREGKSGRSMAEQDAVDASHDLRALNVATLLIDTSPKPGPAASRFADAMNAKYLALPYADASILSGAVKSTQWRSPAL